MFKNLLVVIACIAIPCLVFADTVYLKNGKQIKEVEAIEDGGFVRYYRNGQEISLPKDTVINIEKIDLEKPAPPKEIPVEAYMTEKDKERERKMKESMERVEAIKKGMEQTNANFAADKETDYDEEFVENIKSNIMSISNREKACSFINEKLKLTMDAILQVKKNGLTLTDSLLKNPYDDGLKQKYSEMKKQERTLNATHKMLKETESQFCK